MKNDDEINVSDMREKSRDQAKIIARNISMYFKGFEYFKTTHNLKELTDMFEVCTSLSDKHGRICRHLKHIERDDPKDNWPDEALESFQGYLAYFAMIISKYKISDEQLENAIVNELMKSIEQHTYKGK